MKTAKEVMGKLNKERLIVVIFRHSRFNPWENAIKWVKWALNKIKKR